MFSSSSRSTEVAEAAVLAQPAVGLRVTAVPVRPQGFPALQLQPFPAAPAPGCGAPGPVEDEGVHQPECRLSFSYVRARRPYPASSAARGGNGALPLYRRTR